LQFTCAGCIQRPGDAANCPSPLIAQVTCQVLNILVALDAIVHINKQQGRRGQIQAQALGEPTRRATLGGVGPEIASF
jgi:hypothetical protein